MSPVSTISNTVSFQWVLFVFFKESPKCLLFGPWVADPCYSLLKSVVNARHLQDPKGKQNKYLEEKFTWE